ncbi:MAG: hypothetical protein JSR97_06785 [Verrucomicrobia bacterium]|nr:hypothetical protein [Verrucomicrobiota bacterium]
MLSKIYDYKLEKEALGRIKEMLYSHDFPFKQLQQGLCFPLDLDKTTCFVHLQETKHVAKPSLHRIGLLLQVDLEFKKVNGSQLTSSHLVFIEGITP